MSIRNHNALCDLTTNKFSSLTTKYGIYILLSIAFIPALITVVTRAYGSVENYGWNILYYHVGYETGFGGRKLLASFCHLIFPDFVQLRHIRTMVITINILMVALFVLFVGKCFQKNKSTSTLLTVITLYFIGPFPLTAYMSSGLTNIFIETYQITFTLLWILLWTKHRGQWLFYIFTLIISLICCLLHHTFCCTLFPLYIGLFAYDIIGRNEINLKHLIGYGMICALLLGLLVIIWKFSQMNIGIDLLNEWFKSHVAVDAYESSRQAQTAYYYQTNAENRAAIAHVLSWGYRYGELLCSLLLLSPLLIAVYYPWIRASHTAPTKLSAWRYRLVWILITMITIPVFFIAIDYSRWFVCLFFSMFVATMAAINIGDKHITAAGLRMARFFKTHPIITISLVIYLLGLHITPYSDQYGLKEGIDLWYFIKGIFL